ncbi:MAG: MazG-like family protein [Nanoarchaeota archaeon]
MNNKLLDYIKDLSLKDKKTLSQKALKVSEETGELAKVTLPYDNAHGTTHRFIEKERILEESVDVILTAISMAYELGFSHDDIEEMMWKKAGKWQGIQAKEEKVDYPIIYEIHVTVDASAEDFDIDHFKKVCAFIKVKPIVLDLENDGKTVMNDVMTSSHIVGNNTGSYLECSRIGFMLEDYGFKVVRRKIETVPWHPAAPSKDGDKMPEDCYFEAHINCIITEDEKDRLRAIAVCHNAHLSKNFFKKLEDGKFVNMITYRSYDSTYDVFMSNIELLKADLAKNKIQFEKVITEFSIYDTKVSHDFKWLNKEKQVI